MKKLGIILLILTTSFFSFTMEEKKPNSSNNNLVSSNFDTKNRFPYNPAQIANITDDQAKTVHVLLGTTSENVGTPIIQSTILGFLNLHTHVENLPDDGDKKALGEKMDENIEILRALAADPYSSEFKTYIIQRLFIVHQAYVTYLTVQNKKRRKKTHEPT